MILTTTVGNYYALNCFGGVTFAQETIPYENIDSLKYFVFITHVFSSLLFILFLTDGLSLSLFLSQLQSAGTGEYTDGISGYE